MHELQARPQRVPDETTAEQLARREADLEPSMLAREDTLCHDSMTNAERRWLVENRPANAKHWRVLADLRPEHLNHHD